MSGLLLAGCSHSVGQDARHAAHMTAQQGRFDYQLVQTNPFLLTSYIRAESIDSPVFRVYIEGDGRAWRTRIRPSADPTPSRPMVLKLASIDSYSNVIYLARPCQYSESDLRNGVCSVTDWTDKRFSRKVISAMNQALDFYKQKTNATGFELVAFPAAGMWPVF